MTNGRYVVVKLLYVGSNKAKHYVAQVVGAGEAGEEVVHEVKFLRQSTKAPEKFVFPDVDDASEVEDNFIMKTLPTPIQHDKQTKRKAQFISFDSDLSYCE